MRRSKNSKKIAVSAPSAVETAPETVAPLVTVSDAAPLETSDGSATVETVIVTVDAPPTTDAATVDVAPAPAPAAAPPVAPAPPVRRSLGGPKPLDPASIDARLTFRGAPLNGRPISDGNALTLATIAPLTATDAPALLALAATMLASAGSSISAPDTIPAPAFDDLAIDYLSQRATSTRPVVGNGGYFAPNRGVTAGPSALDRVMYPTRIAERAVRAYCALTGNSRPAFDGGYNGRDATEMRRDSLTAYVSARF
jgi:hypothetical protein